MSNRVSILCNIALYLFLLWELYQATLVHWDPWFAFVVAFVLVVALAITMVPRLHTFQASPGRYSENNGKFDPPPSIH